MVNQISNIVHFDTHVSFWVDDAGISTNVDKSISHIYLLNETKRSGKIYTALTYKDTAILDAMSKLIRNESVTDEEVALLNRIYIRYGWVDKLLKQLLFKRFDTLVAGFVNKSLDQHLKHTDLDINPKTKIPCLKYNSYTIVQYGPDSATLYEHLGFFFQLSKETKTPYQTLLDMFFDHFKSITAEIYTPPEIPPVEEVKPKVRKRAKK